MNFLANEGLTAFLELKKGKKKEIVITEAYLPACSS